MLFFLAFHGRFFSPFNYIEGVPVDWAPVQWRYRCHFERPLNFASATHKRLSDICAYGNTAYDHLTRWFDLRTPGTFVVGSEISRGTAVSD